MPASHAELQDAWETAQSLLQGVEETIIRLQTDDDSALVKFVAARRERVGDVVMRVARPVLDRILQDTTERLAAQNAATGADVAAYISPMVVWLHSNLDRLAAQKANPA
jgi:CHASE3 domain sensor protein